MHKTRGNFFESQILKFYELSNLYGVIDWEVIPHLIEKNKKTDSLASIFILNNKTKNPLIYNLLLSQNPKNEVINLVSKCVFIPAFNYYGIDPERSQRILDETYNEIKISYYLRILYLGFQKILSPNFIISVDWFIASSNIISPKTLISSPNYIYKNENYQFVLSEKYDFEITHFIYKIENQFLFQNLLSIIFQTFHGIETAYKVTGFISNDLHPGNIGIKKVDFFKWKDLIYKRFESKKKYRIPSNLHQGFIVKIFDFGRSTTWPLDALTT